jgi:hypothetical protein
MSRVWSFHDKTHWYHVWGLAISWPNRLLLCLGLDHFMTTQTDTVSEVWPFHDKIDWYYVWGLIISWQTHWYYVSGLTISWQNRLILCLRRDHFMTKQTVTMSGDWSFHDKTDWYYVWGFTITWQNTWILYLGLTFSWQHRSILCLWFDHFMTNQTDTMSWAWPFHDKTDWYYIWVLTISW